MATAPTGLPTVSRFERRRSRTRQALLQAAVELFQQRGTRATTIEAICERADVSPRTFFNHFETREHLYAGIARQRAAEFAALLDACAADPRPVAERLPELFRTVGRGIAAMPAYRDLVDEMLRARLDGGSETTRRGTVGSAAVRFVADAVARGEIGEAHRPEVLADILVGALTTAIGNWSADDAFDLEGELDRAADALLDLFTRHDRGEHR